MTSKAMFINVEVDAHVAANAEIVKKLVEVCPVDIFAQNSDGSLRIVESNLDECTLSYLCVEAARPAGEVRIVKLYE